jgi:hypothetical protein
MKYLPTCLVATATLFGAAMIGAQVPTPVAPVVPAVPGSQPILPVVPAAPVMQPLPPKFWTAAQIRQAFDFADSDGNGELTRAEAQHLTIMPHSFEEMDENKDGVVSRSEYEGMFRR